MKNISKVMVAIGLLAMPLYLSAQKDIKLGHIDSQLLLQQMPESDSAKAVIEKESKLIQDELELLQVEFNNKYNDYITKADSLSNFIRQSKEQELADLQERIRIFQENANQSIQQLQAELFQPIIDDAQKAIEEVGSENGFTYIFDTSVGVILYKADETIDIIDLVKKKLNIE